MEHQPSRPADAYRYTATHFPFMAVPVKWQFMTITIASVLSGCDDASPVRPTAGPLVRDSVRDSSNSCLLNLKDGTSLELFRTQVPGEAPTKIAITAKHRINTHHETGEILDPRQAPIKSLSCTLDSVPAPQSAWISFPAPREKGELSFYMFYYSVPLVTDNLEVPVHFKIVGRDETYTLSVSSLSDLADSPAAYNRFSDP